MKHIDYLYFNIYNYFHRISLNQSFNVRIQAMYLFSIGAGGWLLLLESAYLHLLRHSWFSSKGESMIFAVSLYLLCALLSNYVFIMKDRDLQIFGKYEALANRNPKRNRHLFISIGIMVLPYVALIAMAVAFRKPE